MAKKEKEYTCTVEYTEGFEKRLTEALMDIYYSRKLKGETLKKNDKTA